MASVCGPTLAFQTQPDGARRCFDALLALIQRTLRACWPVQKNASNGRKVVASRALARSLAAKGRACAAALLCCAYEVRGAPAMSHHSQTRTMKNEVTISLLKKKTEIEAPCILATHLACQTSAYVATCDGVGLARRLCQNSSSKRRCLFLRSRAAARHHHLSQEKHACERKKEALRH